MIKSGSESKAKHDTVAIVAVSLTKPDTAASLPNQTIVACPRCDQIYRLSYSDDEWNRVKDWLVRAERALREDHKGGHDASSVAVAWHPVRGR